MRDAGCCSNGRRRAHAAHPCAPVDRAEIAEIDQQIDADDEDGIDQRRADDDGIVAGRHGEHEIAAEARNAGDDLDEERAGQDVGRIDAGDRHHRDQRIASHMTHDDGDRPQALGARRPDIVEMHHLEHRTSKIADYGGERCQGKGEDRNDRRDRECAFPAEGRNPAEADAEHDDKDRGHDIGRHGDAERREHADQPVDHRVPGQGGKRAERQAEHEGKQHGRRAQLQRDRQEVHDDVIDRLGAVAIGGAKIALQRAPEILDILRRKRLIEMELRVERRLDRRLDRPVRAYIPGRARGHMGDEEDERIDEQQGRNAGKRTPDDITQHRSPSGLGCSHAYWKLASPIWKVSSTPSCFRPATFGLTSQRSVGL